MHVMSTADGKMDLDKFPTTRRTDTNLTAGLQSPAQGRPDSTQAGCQDRKIQYSLSYDDSYSSSKTHPIEILVKALEFLHADPPPSNCLGAIDVHNRYISSTTQSPWTITTHGAHGKESGAISSRGQSPDLTGKCQSLNAIDLSHPSLRQSNAFTKYEHQKLQKAATGANRSKDRSEPKQGQQNMKKYEDGSQQASKSVVSSSKSRACCSSTAATTVDRVSPLRRPLF
ncbi:hypothetical protein BDZ89DRAFT_1040268 [Hymenopellis radicata]|nr:hypothetical protein BDZ89DRAFT_1040268 [Hymenopellis radicata]